MNKNDLIEALVPRLGSRGAAALAVEAVVDAVLREVAAGGTVGITGFGTFEPVDRAPRTGRNPHTGEPVPIPAARTPRFRPGGYFKTAVADPDRLPASGLAGARVGSAEDEAEAGRQGAPSTIRRSAGARRSVERDRGQADEVATKDVEGGRRRSGTPATVRAERPEAPADPAGEQDREPGGRQMTIGGEQITLDMITEKKAQLARAQNDVVSDARDDRDTPGRPEKRKKDKKGKDKKGGKKGKAKKDKAKKDKQRGS